MPAAAVTVRDLELNAADLDLQRAADIYREHGCLVVRGLMNDHVAAVRDDILRCMDQAIAQLKRGEGEQQKVGWITPDGTLFIRAPRGFDRDWQVMVTSCRYTSSAALFRSAFEPKLVDIAATVLGEHVELFMDGQCLCKEPVGGHAKLLHQDASYFEHRYEGPMAVLCYAVPTDIQRGALHVVPGSHRLGMLDHVDTESHLGLDPATWTFDKALPVEGDAGDAIFFHVKTIHGSPANHSDGPRPVFIHRYRRADDYVVIAATDASMRKDKSAQIEQAKKENQCGFMVRGYREHHSREQADTQ